MQMKNIPHAPETPNALRKVIAFVVAVVLFGLALMFSVLLFAVVLTAGAMAWGYLWWRTRNLRRQMHAQPPGGMVIEGEVIREEDPSERK